MFLSSIFQPESGDLFGILSVVLGGLGIFLFGLDLMSKSLKKLAGSKMKMLIAKATSSPFVGMITGCIITILIQSSSGTTVIVVGLISAGLMNLSQAIGVIMGAGIGTCVTAFLIGLDLSKYSFLLAAVGAFLVFFIASRKVKLSGNIIFGFGIIFIGLELMSNGLAPIADAAWFTRLMTSFENVPILGLVTGTLLTALVQSSGATIGILQSLYQNQAIALAGALPIMIGCNIGTTSTALIASLGGSREAKQSALANFLFKFFGALLFMILLKPYTALFTWVDSLLHGPAMMTVALSHLFFNVCTALILSFLIKPFTKFIQWLLPAKTTQSTTMVDRLNEDLLSSSPTLALESARGCILDMGALAKQMVVLSHKYLNENQPSYYESVTNLEEEVDYYDHKLHDYLMQLRTTDLDVAISIRQTMYLDTISDIERIGDQCTNIIEFLYNRYDMDVAWEEDTKQNLNDFFDKIDTQVTNALEAFRQNSTELAEEVIALEQIVDTLERTYRHKQLSFIGNGEVSKTDIHFVDILSNLERISDHCENIAQNITDPYYGHRGVTGSEELAEEIAETKKKAS